ncbi:MAG TPA: DUF6502 family protein [Woeseiaceae bacterium]|nr:DUF6502 family protein [Woeseiaceae bacterium]
MQDAIQRKILNALLLALRPIARALLRAGIGFREFDEIAKMAFVDIATKDYGLRGRPTNISRVAVMTGLTRKEVRRLRDKSAAGQEAMVTRPTPMATILHRWYTENEFLSQTGEPAELNFDGPGATFSSLVRRYGGDIPPGAMRTELKRINAVEETARGTLRALKRSVISVDVEERLVTALARVLYPAALTLAHNTGHSNDLWVQRIVFTDNVRDEDVKRIRRIGTDRLIDFTESIDDLFAAYETLYESQDSPEPGRLVGVGVFYFEEADEGTIGSA